MLDFTRWFSELGGTVGYFGCDLGKRIDEWWRSMGTYKNMEGTKSDALRSKFQNAYVIDGRRK